MNENSERSEDLNVLPPTDASQTMAGVPRESAMKEAARAIRMDEMLKATPAPLYETTPQGLQSAEESAGRSCQVIVSGYELLEEIGRGGMGIVYRAKNLGLMRDVAVKLLQERFPINGTAAERFLEEARITGQLQHPGIPPVHQVGRLDGGRPYLAMKLIKGRSLAELIDKKQPMNVLGIFEQIAQTLGYAHANRVIHRDLKPANIMVGAFGEVQVMDWGLAKVLDTPGREDDVFDVKVVRMHGQGESDLETKAGSFLGTPAFMPPEQARGEFEGVGPHSDVFGLGAILCNMITGRPPFKGMDANSTRMLASQGKLDDAYARLDKCNADPEIVALCKKCLAFKSEERPATGAEVATAIAKMRAESEDRARQAEVDKAKAEVQAAEERKRTRVKQRLGLAVLAAVLLGGGFAVWQLFKAIAAEKKTQQAYVTLDEQTVKLVQSRHSTASALNAMTDEVIEKLFGRQPKLDANERNFLKRVIDLYADATDKDGNSTEAQSLRAEGSLRVGKLWQKLGDDAEAEKALVEARNQEQHLVDTQPRTNEYRRQLISAQSLLGKLYAKMGRPVDAEKNFSYARDTARDLDSNEPKTERNLSALAGCRENLGSYYLSQGRLPEAEREYGAALDVRKKLAEASPAIAEHQYLLAACHERVGIYFREKKNLERADAEFQDAETLLTGLIEKDKANDQYRQRLAKVLSNRANLGRVMGNDAAAERAYQAAIATMTSLTDEFPSIPEYAHERSVYHNNLGVHYRTLDRLKNAEAEFQAAIALQTKLVKAAPADASYNAALGNTYVGLALTKRKAKADDDAKNFFEKGLPYHAAALANDPRNKAYQKGLREHCDAVIDMHLQRQDRAAVRATAAAMLKIAPEYPEMHVVAARYLARSSGQATDAAEKEQDAAAAVQLLETAGAKGWTDAAAMERIAEFATLKGRDDFQKMLSAIKPPM